MEKKTLTVPEALDATIQNLKNINVPVYLSNQIGVPISQSVHNLSLIYNIITSGENNAECNENQDDEQPAEAIEIEAKN